MKPTKNRIYCVDARRPKMVFESEAAANRFIKFNSQEISESGHKVPTRSYFCVACGGYHVTSQPEKPEYKSKVERYFDHKVERTDFDKQLKEITEHLSEILYLYIHRKQRASAQSIYIMTERHLTYLNQQNQKLCCRIMALSRRIGKLFETPENLTLDDIFGDLSQKHKLYGDMRHLVKLMDKKIDFETQLSSMP